MSEPGGLHFFGRESENDREAYIPLDPAPKDRSWGIWRATEEVLLNSTPTKETAQMLALISENERLREKVALLESASIAFHSRRQFIWWQGVNAQWKHRPIGNRLPEAENPYGGAL